MPHETIFTTISISVLPAWILPMFAPRWVWTRRIVHAAFIPLLFGAFYTCFLIINIFFGVSAEGTNPFSLAGVMALFDTPTGALVGWSHYLVFDLFVGAWISRDAIDREINYSLVLPCLFFTFMLGPVGLMLYLLLRLLSGKGGLALGPQAT